MKILISILISIFCIYLVICALLYAYQEKLIFFPRKLRTDFEYKFVNDFEEKFFQIDDETTINALHFFPKENKKGTILYFHGNAGSLDGWGDVAQDFVALGYEVLISDYRGYGKSTGPFSEQGLYDDARFLYDFLLSENEAQDIIIYGRSLGTGVAVDLASQVKAKQLILETPFANFPELAYSQFSVFPVKSLLRYQFRNDLKIKKVTCPIHIFHGTKDQVVPYTESQQLIHILEDESVLTTIPNGGHNNLGTFSLFWKKMKAILM